MSFSHEDGFDSDDWEERYSANLEDNILSAEYPRDYISKEFPEYPVAQKPHKAPRERLINAAYLSAFAIGVCLANYYGSVQLTDLFKNFH